jgi:hypothetical protein
VPVQAAAALLAVERRPVRAFGRHRPLPGTAHGVDHRHEALERREVEVSDHVPDMTAGRHRHVQSR